MRRLGRVVFADLDGVTIEESVHRLSETDLPAPTLIVASGGVHCYWRLAQALTDLGQWSVIQRGLAAQLGGDPAVNDAPRIMRLPGFANHTYESRPLARIIEGDPDRFYELVEFEGLVIPEPAASPATAGGPTDNGRIREGRRNDTLFRLAAGMRARRFTAQAITAALLAENTARCDPPLADDEVHRIAASAGRYPANGGSAAVALEWAPFPTNALPEPLRSFVEETAAALRCAPSMCALPALVMCAAAIGTTRVCSSKQVGASLRSFGLV